jgi:hypothetical protein
VVKAVKVSLSAIILLYGLSAAAARNGAYSPVGRSYGGTNLANVGMGGAGAAISQWKQEWSDAYFQCAEKIPEAKEMFDKMSNGEVSDLGPGRPWCSNSDVFRPENIRLFQLATLKHLAKPESGYRPEAMNPNSPNPPAVGLFQIGPSDVEFHKCEGPDGKKLYTGAKYQRGNNRDPRVTALKDPKNNVCCALKIAARVALNKWKGAGKGKSGKLVFAEGRTGIMGKFWEPMRVQASKGAKGEQMRAEINKTCDSFTAGGTFTTADVDQARRAPASNGSGATQFASVIGNATR